MLRFLLQKPICLSARTIAAIALLSVLLIAVTAPAADHPTKSAQQSGPQTLVIFIGGMDSDPTPAQIAGTALENRGNSGLFQLRGELEEKRFVSEYFNWNGTVAGNISAKKPPLISSVIKRIRSHRQEYPNSQVAIVGNSWGGHTAWQVAVQLKKADAPFVIDLIVFLDPSSAGRVRDPQPRTLPMNVKRAVHYRTRNVFCWDRWNVDRVRDVDLGDSQLGYMKDGKPDYAAVFNFRAHVAAEWDPRIHAEIRQELLKLLPKQ